MQPGDKVRKRRPLQFPGPPPLQVIADTFLAPRHRQQFSVEFAVPLPVQSRLLKGEIEGRPVTIGLRVRQGAIDIENQGLQRDHFSPHPYVHERKSAIGGIRSVTNVVEPEAARVVSTAV